MMLDFEVQRCTRRCAATGRDLAPGEAFYSVLTVEGANVVRHDYASEAWHGPPEKILGWWQSRMPTRDSKRLHMAPNDVMLHLLDELSGAPEKWDMRYVLSLLLVRRRVIRLESTEVDDTGHETSVLYCPRTEETIRVATVKPDTQRTQQIQEELSRLLFADAG